MESCCDLNAYVYLSIQQMSLVTNSPHMTCIKMVYIQRVPEQTESFTFPKFADRQQYPQLE
jgi:hypothetical protein